MKPVSLKDLKPEASSLTLNGKLYKLRAVTLDDWVWMGDALGGDPSQKLAGSLPLSDLARICYRLLIDKSDFLSEEREVINDEGDKVTVKVTGPQKLMENIVGFQGIEAMTEAFTVCLGVHKMSEKELENIAKDSEKKSKKGRK